MFRCTFMLANSSNVSVSLACVAANLFFRLCRFGATWGKRRARISETCLGRRAFLDSLGSPLAVRVFGRSGVRH